ncbi:mannitol-1-phosphate dehydrogenase [Moesziomyces antarcticus]|uniref:alcohol dehydrogenase n=2 Tax=Pseudozyma antarctica TaxID=84753 RepID=A0A081CC85_PSEA2|nr:mannitol-1-phosphate dehydrogenase [Moesziomyces antarcticus]GAK64281.1 mannitol-1-phosphate dehydrogenase [Moesziomyces antarcticus]SPO45216.1 probable ADH3 - alcohol dehydrogenase III [Moesziomyces antarcticus]
MSKDPRETQLELAPTNRVAIFHEHGGPDKISIQQLDTTKQSELNAGEVLVRVLYTGVCHSDLHALQGDWPAPTKLPLIGGHEGAGIVVALGPGSQEYVQVGDRVGIKWIADACLNCEWCRLTHEINCAQYKPSGYAVDGTFQQYVRHTARYLTKIPDALPLDQAAPILCAGVTIYRALKEAHLQPGNWVVIPGSGGGLGHLGVQYARNAGLRVIGIDTGDDKKKMSLELGCEVFVDFKSTSDVPSAIKEATGGAGAHAAVVAAATSAAYEQALDYLRPRGTLVIVGMPNSILPVSIFKTVLFTHRIVGSAVGNRQDAVEALEIAATGRVKVQFTLKGLSDLPDVFQAMIDGKIAGRVVLDVDK